MPPLTKDTVEERTRHWLESSYLDAVRNLRADVHGVYDEAGAPRRLTALHFQEVQRKLKVFRWLDRLSFDSFVDVGSGYDQFPHLVRERYGVPSFYADFSHSMNLPYGGALHGKLDHAVTLNIVRLPFPDDAFDVVLSSEVLEHLVRPVDCIAELLRVTRRYLIMTSLEALSTSRWQRWLSHLRVDVTAPHVERNFFLLRELEALFGAAGWHHENLFFDAALPVSSFRPAAEQDAVYGTIRDRARFAEALCAAVAIDDHRPGAMGILIVKAKRGDAVAAAGDPRPLAEWLIERTAAAQRDGFRLVEQIRAGTAPFAAPERPVAAELLARLCCPDCRAALVNAGAGLRCSGCGAVFRGEYGVPVLYPQRYDEAADDEARVLDSLCGTDTARRAVARRLRARLRRNEQPAGRLRRLLWR